MALPSPAPFSTRTVWPARTSASTPAGTIATRYSSALISRGIPIFIPDPLCFEETVHPDSNLFVARGLAQHLGEDLVRHRRVGRGGGAVRVHDVDHHQDAAGRLLDA